MGHVGIAEIVSGVVSILAERGTFSEVRGAVLTGYKNLFELVPDLTNFPAALVAAGGMTFADQGVTRELDLAVIVIDEFRLDAGEALAGLALIDGTVSALSGPVPGMALTVGRAHLSLSGVEPLELDSAHCAWMITFNAQSSI